MARFSRTIPALTAAWLFSSTLALAQQPAPPAAPPGPAAPPAPAGEPAPAAPARPAPAPPAAPPVTGPALDRGSLLAPSTPVAPAARPAAPAAPAAAPPAVATPAPATGERPSADGQVGAKPSDVYSEDWWTHSHPVLEIHGYFRTRAELFHNFALGRLDSPNTAIWPQPADNSYTDAGSGVHNVKLCGADAASLNMCNDKSQASANMRFRLNPELHISDNVRIMSQIDMLDNLVLGSTPEGYYNQPSSGGYSTVTRGGYVPLAAFTTTQVPPTAGVNSYQNSIAVKRVWGEYMTPVGQLRFGRMPSHWGLGMVANSGDTYDSDYQSTSDRIMFVSGIKSIDLYFAGAWDFVNTGATSATADVLSGGQPYNLANLENVNQWAFIAVRRRNPELQKLELAKGDVVVNGGMYFIYRSQIIANDTSGVATDQHLGQGSGELAQSFVRRGAKAYIPDGWVQILYKKFRFEAEGVMINGSVDNTLSSAGGNDYASNTAGQDPGWKIRQFGLATQTELKAIEDRMRIQFGFGWASGDQDVTGVCGGGGAIAPSRTGAGLQPQCTTDRTFSEFRFHPDYRVDLILFRNILTRVQGSYYFRPSVDYDFARNTNGQRFGGGGAVIWSRASEFMQAPGHKRDLGVEIDLSLYYQSKDGSLNDNPDKMGGFFTMLQYGVLFPLGGLNYLPGEQKLSTVTLDTSTAQTLRWYMGILF